MQKYQCETLIIHKDAVKEVQEHLIDDIYLSKMSELFKVISDPTRIKILYILEKQELCVCDISVILKMSQSAISHQLRVLRNHHLVKSRKDGKTVFYTLKDDHVQHIFNQTLEHIYEDM